MRVALPAAYQYGMSWILVVVLLFLCIDGSHSFPYLIRPVFGVHRHSQHTASSLPSTLTSTNSLSAPTTSTNLFHFLAYPQQKTSVSRSFATKTSPGVSSSHVRATSTGLSSLTTDAPFVEDMSVFKIAKASTTSSSSRHLRVVEVPIWKSYIRRLIEPRAHVPDLYATGKSAVVATLTARAAIATTLTLAAGNWTIPTAISGQNLTTNRPTVTLTYPPHSVARTENRLETLALHSSIPNSPVPPTKQSLIRAQMDALREKYERQQAAAKSKALAEQKIKAASAQKAAWMTKFREEHTRSIENQHEDMEHRKEETLRDQS
ncbi:hypothetical protein MMC14_006461 [Varicellaria rhodocarpa]|nr:hypothetical protein [Varicellaria rhodocarpa]